MNNIRLLENVLALLQERQGKDGLDLSSEEAIKSVDLSLKNCFVILECAVKKELQNTSQEYTLHKQRFERYDLTDDEYGDMIDVEWDILCRETTLIKFLNAVKKMEGEKA